MVMAKAYLGIDPGANGAIVALVDGEMHPHILRFGKATEKEIWEFISGLSFDYDCFCTLELVGAMPGQGVSSMFTFGDGVGFIRGLLTAAYIPFEKKVPRTWQKELGITPRVTGKKEGETEESKVEFKRRLREKAEQLFPLIKMTNDIADALLIAEFTRRTIV
jgi:crossover junction endodeoxyribonuclease RuvC